MMIICSSNYCCRLHFLYSLSVYSIARVRRRGRAEARQERHQPAAGAVARARQERRPRLGTSRGRQVSAAADRRSAALQLTSHHCPHCMHLLEHEIPKPARNVAFTSSSVLLFFLCHNVCISVHTFMSTCLLLTPSLRSLRVFCRYLRVS